MIKAKGCLARLTASAVAIVLSASPIARAGDWPQWGGQSGRNMYSPETGLPAQFDPGKFKPGTDAVDRSTARGLRWAATLGSQSYGNVTVSGGKVFIGTNNGYPRDAQHVGDRSILMCFDEQTGEFLWQLVVPKLAAGRANDWDNIGIVASPAIDGNRVYIVTTRCEVLCLDINGMADGNDGPFKDESQYVVVPDKPKAAIGPQDADIIWQFNMLDELGAFPHNAANCSVLIVGDIVYAGTANGHDWSHVNVPSPFTPSLIALDKRTGEYLGGDDANIGPRIFHGQWSSPSAGTVNGRMLIFFGGGDGVCYAFDAKPAKEGSDGYLEKVWRYDANPNEYKVKDGKPIKYGSPDGPSEINATPVFYNNCVYVAIGQDPEYGDGVGRLVCIDATKTGDITQSGAVWDCKSINRSISTVSIDPSSGLLFVADLSGFVYCFDAETGKHHWTHDMKSYVWASTMVADGKVFLGDEQGDFVVMSAAKDKNIIFETTFDGPVYSTPVIANGSLYISTASHLYAFSSSASK